MNALEQTAWSAVESVREMLRVGEAAKMELAYLHEMLDGAHIPRYSAPDEDGKAGPFSMAHRLGMLIEREKAAGRAEAADTVAALIVEQRDAFKAEAMAAKEKLEAMKADLHDLFDRAKGAMDRFDAHTGAPLDQRILAWEEVIRKDATKTAKQEPTEQGQLAAEKRLRLTAEDQLRAARRKLFEMQQEVDRARFELEDLKKESLWHSGLASAQG